MSNPLYLKLKDIKQVNDYDGLYHMTENSSWLDSKVTIIIKILLHVYLQVNTN